MNDDLRLFIVVLSQESFAVHTHCGELLPCMVASVTGKSLICMKLGGQFERAEMCLPPPSPQVPSVLEGFKRDYDANCGEYLTLGS